MCVCVCIYPCPERSFDRSITHISDESLSHFYALGLSQFQCVVRADAVCDIPWEDVRKRHNIGIWYYLYYVRKR